MKKITLEEHFISPEYAQHVRDLQSKGAGADHLLFSTDYPYTVSGRRRYVIIRRTKPNTKGVSHANHVSESDPGE